MKARLFAVLALALALLALSSCSIMMTPTTTAPGTQPPATTPAVTTPTPVTTAPDSPSTEGTTAPTSSSVATTTTVTTAPSGAASRPAVGEAPNEQYPALLTRICKACGQELSIAFNPHSERLELILAEMTGVCSCEIRSYVNETETRAYRPFTYFSGNFTVYASTVPYVEYSFVRVGTSTPILHLARVGDVITGEDAKSAVPSDQLFLGFSRTPDGASPFESFTVDGDTGDYTYYVVCKDKTEPKPDTVSLTLKSDIPFIAFYKGSFVSWDYKTEMTLVLPYGSYTSELEFCFEETKKPSQSTYKVKTLLLDGKELTSPVSLTEGATLRAIPVELYSYTLHFANNGFEMIEAELGADIATVLADSRKGDLGDLLASFSGGGYINLPIFYTDEARSESCRVTEFSADFTDIWLGKKTAPRLTLVCIEQCTLRHETELSMGYILSDMLAWHGVNNETDGVIEVVFYLDEDCTVPYVEEFPLTYYTEDVTLYGKPSREPSAAPTEATIYLTCPACGSIGLGKTYFGLTLREMIAAALSDCCSASASDYRWYTYDAFGMNVYFSDAELDSAPNRSDIAVFGEIIGTGGGAGGDTVTCDVSIVCPCASCAAAGGTVTVTVPYGSTLADLEARHEHGLMALIFTYYYDAGYTEEMSRSATIEADMTIYAYHPDLSDGTLLAIRCCDCGAETPAQRNDGTSSALALLDLVCPCSAPRELYVYDPGIGEYVPIEPYMSVPTYCTELVNDPIYSISFVCDCGHAYTNTAQISKGITANELILDYAASTHPVTGETVTFYLDEARTVPFSYEGVLHDHLTVYTSCTPAHPY